MYMGFFRDLSNLYKLYKDDLEKKASRDKLLAQGITEDWVKELMRQADTGVVAELVFPSGVSLKITRTLKGADINAAGVDYRETYLVEKE